MSFLKQRCTWYFPHSCLWFIHTVQSPLPCLALLCSASGPVVDSHVLSTRKAEKPGHMLDPIRNTPSTHERPMYCKEKVYCGTQEFSFEEIRGLRYMERKQKQRQEGKFGEACCSLESFGCKPYKVERGWGGYFKLIKLHVLAGFLTYCV